jgi:hypothetical protein
MSFKPHTYQEVKAEQAAIQPGKVRGRTLVGYNGYIFSGADRQPPRSSAVIDLCTSLALGRAVSIESVLLGLTADSLNDRAYWVDMGGGYGSVMSQAACIPGVTGNVEMAKVDLEDINLTDFDYTTREYLESLQPGMTLQHAQPDTIVADAQTVTLSRPAHLITAVESVQYFDNPLGAIVRWYNQLADHGLLITFVGLPRPDATRYPDTQAQPNRSPNRDMFQQLAIHGIRKALTDEADTVDGFRPDVNEDCYRVLAIQKTPGTELALTVPVAFVSSDTDGYKTVTYELPLASSPFMQVITQQ